MSDKKVQIAPSILSADFGRLNEDIKTIEPYVDLIHVDVMDGHFVPNLTCGAPVVAWIKSELPLDVHLMIENPEKYLEDFARAGSAMITVHSEACDDLSGTIDKIHELGCKAGVSIKPKTPVSDIDSVLEKLDLVLVMSVEPGFGGQGFMSESIPKIKELREKRPEMDISVDGGINAETGKLVKDAGANILVAGSYIFRAKDRQAAIESLR
ncbi:MAG: ribulose-phosphate 3-epimerase [Patescibacteria group bacterium]|nr:ribulose-phosphate 3-epimerase [Patescibacteria group bacterium]